MSLDHDFFMARSLELARQSGAEGNRPIGSVIVDRQGNIIGEGRNKIFTESDPLWHAENAAISEAARRLKRRDFGGHTIYSSQEACPMCMWAIVMANFDTLVLGGRAAAFGSPGLGGYTTEGFLELTGSRVKLVTGVREQECIDLRRAWNEERTRNGLPER